MVKTIHATDATVVIYYLSCILCCTPHTRGQCCPTSVQANLSCSTLQLLETSLQPLHVSNELAVFLTQEILVQVYLNN